MQEKLNYKYTLCSEPTLHDVMLLHFATHLSYGFYYLVKRTTKYNITKSCKPSEMQNVMNYTYVGGFTFNTTTQDICNSPPKNETNIITTFTTKHDKF